MPFFRGNSPRRDFRELHSREEGFGEIEAVSEKELIHISKAALKFSALTELEVTLCCGSF